MEDLRTQTAREHDAWRALIADLSRALAEGVGDRAVILLNTLTARFRRSVRELSVTLELHIREEIQIADLLQERPITVIA